MRLCRSADRSYPESSENLRCGTRRLPRRQCRFESSVADEVSQQPRFLLFDEEPRAGAGQDTRDEDGRQRDVQRVSSREPGPEMASHRSGRQEQAVADDGQRRGSLDAPGEVDDEGTEVADEEGERDARDTDQELGHVTLSVGSPKTDPMHLVSSDSAPRPKKCGGAHAVDSETPPGPPTGIRPQTRTW